MASGRHVPLSSTLLDFLAGIVPENNYSISTWVDTPKPQKKPDGCWRKELIRDIERTLNFEIRDYGEECSMPGIHIGVKMDPPALHHVPPENSDREHGYSWLFPELRVVAIPLHPSWDNDRIEYYREKMEASPDYQPTCLVLVPPRAPPFAVGGIVLDGHHKLAAAGIVGRPLRLILVKANERESFGLEDEDEEEEDEEPLPWYRPSQELIEKARRGEK
jgi:hypothetical protein